MSITCAEKYFQKTCEDILHFSKECATIFSYKQNLYGGVDMKHIKTIETKNLCQSAKNGGCGECQTSCQSACKTSCGIANQQCESKK